MKYSYKIIFFLINLCILNQLLCGNEVPNYSLPKNEYLQYMKRIKEVNPAAYEKLTKCATQRGRPCIEKPVINGDIPKIIPENDYIAYPILILPSTFKEFNQKFQMSDLEELLNEYEAPTHVQTITDKERHYVLDIIKSFDHELYNLMMKNDPTGSRYVTKAQAGSYGGGTGTAEEDGLPSIGLDDYLLRSPYNELRAVIGHELSHYILNHLTENPKLTHQQLAKEIDIPQSAEFKPGKKVPQQLTFSETFVNAYTRIQEYEADRYSVLELGGDIDDAIAWIQGKYSETKDNYKGSSLTTTHPLDKDRIQQLEDLRKEVELRKIHKTPRPHINWQALAENYLSEVKRLKEEKEEALLSKHLSKEAFEAHQKRKAEAEAKKAAMRKQFEEKRAALKAKQAERTTSK